MIRSGWERSLSLIRKSGPPAGAAAAAGDGLRPIPAKRLAADDENPKPDNVEADAYPILHHFSGTESAVYDRTNRPIGITAGQRALGHGRQPDCNGSATGRMTRRITRKPIRESQRGAVARRSIEAGVLRDCRPMVRRAPTSDLSELQAQHELKAPRRADPSGAGVQLAGDDPELAGPIRDIGIRIAVDRMVEQVKRLGSELQFQPFGKGNVLLERRVDFIIPGSTCQRCVPGSPTCLWPVSRRPRD